MELYNGLYNGLCKNRAVTSMHVPLVAFPKSPNTPHLPFLRDFFPLSTFHHLTYYIVNSLFIHQTCKHTLLMSLSPSTRT